LIALLAALLVLTPAQIAQELKWRNRAIEALFPEQRVAVLDESPLRGWQCDRRAGKTSAAIHDFANDGMRNPGHRYAYIALTRDSAENIAWPIIHEINRKLQLNLHVQDAKLRATLPNGAALRLYGADRPQWMERLYGLKQKKIWIDEAAFFRSADVQRLVYDILEPTVADLEGQITIMSRPGHINRGFFYDVCHGKRNDFSVKKWSWRDNPHVAPQVHRLIARKKAENPDIESDPSFRRNWMNEWVAATGKRVYGGFEIERNGIDSYELQRTDQTILGIDLGFFDHTAFSVLAWSPTHPLVYELESHRETEMAIDKIAARIRMYRDYYPGIRIVGDPDRRQAFEELKRRYSLPIIAAQKSDKRHWIDLINADYAAAKAKIVAPESSGHVEEMLDLVWEQRPNGVVREQHGMSNDGCDAFLYAYRAALHWRYKEPEQRLERGSKRWYAREVAKMEKAAEKHFEELGYFDD